MSLHIMYTHRCKNCESRYIPYQKNLKCPKCGIKKMKECSVVEDIVKSALFKKYHMENIHQSHGGLAHLLIK